MKNYEILRSDVQDIIGDKFSWYNDKYRSGKRRLKFSWLSDEDRERVYNILKDKGYDVRNYFNNFDRLVVYLND
jgi:hypothetical protein